MKTRFVCFNSPPAYWKHWSIACIFFYTFHIFWFIHFIVGLIICSILHASPMCTELMQNWLLCALADADVMFSSSEGKTMQGSPIVILTLNCSDKERTEDNGRVLQRLIHYPIWHTLILWFDKLLKHVNYCIHSTKHNIFTCAEYLHIFLLASLN